MTHLEFILIHIPIGSVFNGTNSLPLKLVYATHIHKRLRVGYSSKTKADGPSGAKGYYIAILTILMKANVTHG